MLLILNFTEAVVYIEDFYELPYTDLNSGTNMRMGVFIVPLNNSYSIIGINKSTKATPGYCYVQDGATRQDLVSGTFVGDVCNFSVPYLLIQNKVYLISTDNNGANWTHNYKNMVSNMPYNDTYVEWLSNCNNNGTTNSTTQAWTITHLYLNYSNASLTINTNLITQKNVTDYTEENIIYNGTYFNTNGIFNCTLLVNNQENYTHINVNLSNNQNISYNYGFFYGTKIFRINCTNPDVNSLSSSYTYNVDTTRFILYQQNLYILSFITNFMALFPIFLLTVFYIMILYLGFYLLKQGSRIFGIVLIYITLLFDLFYYLYFEDNLFQGYQISSLASVSGDLTFKTICYTLSYLGFSVYIAVKLVFPFLYKLRKKEYQR